MNKSVYEIDIFSSTGRILIALLNSPQNISQIIKVCDVSQPTANRILKRLEKAGILYGKSSEGDLRQKVYYLTPNFYSTLSSFEYLKGASRYARRMKNRPILP